MRKWLKGLGCILSAQALALILAGFAYGQNIGPVTGQGPGNIGPAYTVLGNHPVFNGSPPVANSSCGTGASVAGTDASFTLTLGTGSNSACRVAFTTPWNSRPVCSQDSSSLLSTVAVTTSGITLSGGTVDGASFDFICVARPGG